MTASFLVAAAGLLVTAALSQPGGEGVQLAPGIDMKVSSLVADVISSGSPSAPPAPDLTISTSPNTFPPLMPAGAFALSMLTTSCNAGTTGQGWVIPFRAVPDFRHMYIATSMYRTNANGRLEQLAVGWVKHSFSSASENQVAVSGANGSDPCGNGNDCVFDGNGGGSGSNMGQNCADVYWGSLNAGNTRLGPRYEIIPNDPYVSPSAYGTDTDPFTVAAALPAGRDFSGWRPRGSFFDNYTQSGGTDVPAAAGSQNDGSMTYSAGTGSLMKRNVILNSEVEGANINAARHVFMETYYILNGDYNKFNNVAWRRFTVSGSAPYTSSKFAYAGRHTYGPPLIAWATEAGTGVNGNYATTSPTTVDISGSPAPIGTAYVGVRVTPLAGGKYRYDYNVYNLDIDRGIRGFDIPVPVEGVVSDVQFRQPREYMLASMDKSAWTNSFDGVAKETRWAAPVVAGNIHGLQATNTIRFGNMYTFSFVSPLKPRTGAGAQATLTLGPSRTGVAGNSGIPNTDVVSEISAPITVPAHPCDIATAGGGLGADGFLTGDDFDAFITAFFDGNTAVADIATAGTGALGADEFLTGEDFDAFIFYFFNE